MATQIASVEPMLAKIAEEVPPEGEFLYEPKWDGFRAIVFRDAAGVRIQSRDLKPLDRYFPELHAALHEGLPARCVLDGEIVIAGAAGLDFDALLQRVHPAASRVQRLARETPASFVAFDLLALDGRDLQQRSQSERRMLLEAFMADIGPPIHLTPMTESRAVALQWLDHFEGAGLDGVVAKRADGAYLPGERAMFKVKHVRTADCVLAGLRWHKSGDDAVGSLLLGLWDAEGVLQHVGATSSFDMATRRALARELAPLMRNAGRGHPWIGADDAATAALQARQRAPGARTRWNSGKDLSWVPLRPERVCEVRYDHLQGDRFRHGAIFVRWRPDKPAAACTYAQCEVTPPYELARVFATERTRPASA
ncbi:ATP-dependent DNA ligase [Variovorax boronicumulans]|uniref:ATP-dependent DNA ligase n=1 Tax=Variovorax boronicumulans TaxID=436515 RepID=UPI00278580EE|nr:ATP-dependent DNA ligase [Variovorax boronicumulans]MDP9991291.1 ATP-dependent DNA ligase [Variovorax boronicumulans]MDQ0003345.1 ATP-dependent DNA ligase [Variovorax boronicumulans]MDQ0041374.1 ATP-dependent DNA ligase [Variovorax boronicumulans]